MRVSTTCQPSYTLAYVRLDYGESVLTVTGSVALMSAGIRAGVAAPGGVVRSVSRRFLGEESFFMGKYTAELDDAWVALAPRYPGDVLDIELEEGKPLLVEAGKLLAFSEGVQVDVRYAGLSNIALHEGAAVLKASGRGHLLLSAYGGLEHFQLLPGDPVVVDTGHLVAWSASCGFKVGPLGGVIGSQFNGEGMVGEITGPGDLYVQSRAEQNLRDWLLPERFQNSGRGASS